MLSIALMLTLGCGKGGAPEPAPVEPPPVEEAAGDASAEAPDEIVAGDPDAVGMPALTLQPMRDTLADADLSPADLYGSCKERVEGPSADGECATDADCMKTGCSQEMCVAATTEGLMSTCEVLPCFSVLNDCGCVEGICSWRIADAAPDEQAPEGEAPAPE